MKVQCGQCPAKYAVADDRVRDKKVRIHCKRCNAAIVVDGKVDPPLVTTTPARPSVGPARPSSAPESAPPAPPEPQRASPRPVAHTILGGLEAPAAERLAEARAEADARPTRGRPTPPSSPQITLEPPRGKPAADRGMTDPPSQGEPDRWRVALTQNDLRWMTTREIGEAYQAGAVQLETFVFRTGMPNWVTLMEVPELAQAVGQTSAAAEDEATKFRARPADQELHDPAFTAEATGEPLPFALVAEKAAPLGGDIHDSVPTPLVPPPVTDDGRVAFEAAGAALGAKAEGGSSKAWVWVVLVLVVVGAAVLFLGPRFGLKLR